MTPTQTDYDSPWKELLDPYFRPFLELFFPTVAQAIDWERGYEFLDKEFQRRPPLLQPRRYHYCVTPQLAG